MNFFFLHIFINTSQPNQDAGIGREATPGGTAGGRCRYRRRRRRAKSSSHRGRSSGGLAPHHPQRGTAGTAALPLTGEKTPHQSTISTRNDALKYKFSPPSKCSSGHFLCRGCDAALSSWQQQVTCFQNVVAEHERLLFWDTFYKNVYSY